MQEYLGMPSESVWLETNRKLASETLRADQGWQRYESANTARNNAEAELAKLKASAPAGEPVAIYQVQDLDTTWRDLPHDEWIRYGELFRRVVYAAAPQEKAPAKD